MEEGPKKQAKKAPSASTRKPMAKWQVAQVYQAYLNREGPQNLGMRRRVCENRLLICCSFRRCRDCRVAEACARMSAGTQVLEYRRL